MSLIGIQFGLGDAYGRGILEGIGAFFRANPGWRGVLLNVENEMSDHWLQQSSLRGVLVRVYTQEELGYCHWVARMGKALVVVSNTSARDEFPSVRVDDREVGRMAARFFVGKGFRSLTFVTRGGESSCSSQERWEGFSREAQALQAGAEWLCTPSALDALLRHAPRPLAVLARNDHLGRLVLENAVALGLQVPHDIAVLGIDNDPLESVLSPFDLSSIDINLPAIGRAACERIADGQLDPATPIIVPPLGIVERSSTDTLAFADPVLLKAMRHIRGHSLDPIGVPEVARAAGVSRRVLERKFNDQVGRGIHAELVLARLDEASRLLRDSTRSTQEIAQACGFNDYRGFLRDFKRRHGLTPQRYRARS